MYSMQACRVNKTVAAGGSCQPIHNCKKVPRKVQGFSRRLQGWRYSIVFYKLYALLPHTGPVLFGAPLNSIASAPHPVNPAYPLGVANEEHTFPLELPSAEGLTIQGGRENDVVHTSNAVERAVKG